MLQRQRGVLRRLALGLPLQLLDARPQLLDLRLQLGNSSLQQAIMAWASGGCRAMISSVTTTSMPHVVPFNQPPSRDQFPEKIKKSSQAVNGYSASRYLSRTPIYYCAFIIAPHNSRSLPLIWHHRPHFVKFTAFGTVASEDLETMLVRVFFGCVLPLYANRRKIQ